MEYLVTMTTHVPAGTPAAAVGAARPWTRAGSVAGQRPGRAAGDAEIAAAGPVDDGADHAADPAPERPGQPVMSETGQRVAIITGGSQGIGAGLVEGYRRRGWAVVASARTIKPSEDPD